MSEETTVPPPLAAYRKWFAGLEHMLSDTTPYGLFAAGWDAARASGEAKEEWHGIRVTLACGHMDLREPGEEQRQRWVIGGKSACWVCPARRRRTGGEVADLRTIVNVEPVTAPREPESLDPVHWYWEGEGD